MCEIGEIIKKVAMCKDCLRHEVSCIGSDDEQERCFINKIRQRKLNEESVIVTASGVELLNKDGEVVAKEGIDINSARL